MGGLTGIDISILAAECIAVIGLLSGIIFFSGKLKKLRAQNEKHQEQEQKDALDELLKNTKRR